MNELLSLAPQGEVTEYDRRQMALYAALLDAADAQAPWQNVVTTLMGLDPSKKGVLDCWHSHLERARWIASDGLAQAIHAFGRSDG